MCPPCPKTMACVRACVCVCVHCAHGYGVRHSPNNKKIVPSLHDNHSLLPFCIMTLFFFFRVRIRGPHANYFDQPALQIPTCFNAVWSWQRSATHRLSARGGCSSQRFLLISFAAATAGLGRAAKKNRPRKKRLRRTLGTLPLGCGGSGNHPALECFSDPALIGYYACSHNNL